MAAVPTDDRLFRAMFEGTLDALLLADDDGTYIEANEAAGELLGCSSDELVGQSIADFLSADVDFEAAWNAFLEKGHARGQLEIRRPDGTVRTVEFAASAVILPGIHLSALRDVTDRETDRLELRRKTDMLTKVFETSPVGIVVVEADGQIVDANQRAETVLGLTRAEITDRTYDDDRWRLLSEDGTTLRTPELPVSTAIERGEPVFDAELGIETPTGDTVWLSVNAAPIHDVDGAVDRIVAVVSDAEREARIIQGEADARRNNIFAEAFNQDQEFFEFYRSLEAYRKAMQENNTRLVLSPDHEFFDYLRSPSGAPAAPQQ